MRSKGADTAWLSSRNPEFHSEWEVEQCRVCTKTAWADSVLKGYVMWLCDEYISGWKQKAFQGYSNDWGSRPRWHLHKEIEHVIRDIETSVHVLKWRRIHLQIDCGMQEQPSSERWFYNLCPEQTEKYNRIINVSTSWFPEHVSYLYSKQGQKKTNIVQTFLSGLFEFLNTFATEDSVFYLSLSTEIMHREKCHGRSITQYAKKKRAKIC